MSSTNTDILVKYFINKTLKVRFNFISTKPAFLIKKPLAVNTITRNFNILLLLIF